MNGTTAPAALPLLQQPVLPVVTQKCLGPVVGCETSWSIVVRSDSQSILLAQYEPKHYSSSYTANHARPTTATAQPRCWTGRRTTLDTYIWRSRPRAPGLQSEVMTPSAGLLGIERGLLKSATLLDWTMRAALHDCADRRRKSGVGLTQFGTGRGGDYCSPIRRDGQGP